METYCGIMDCHGVEHFTEGTDNKFYRMRAMANDQRHALYYEVQLTDEEKQDVEKLLGNNDWEAACVYIKNKETFISRGPGKPHLIPNPDLDPWR